MQPAALMLDHHYPLKGICEGWRQLFDRAEKDKHEKFQKYANEASKFFNGPHNFMWDNQYAQGKGGFLGQGQAPIGLPNFRMSVNKLFEAVAIFGPMLYHNNPDITCTPRPPVDLPPDAFGLDPMTMDPMGMDPVMMYQIQMLYQQEMQHQNKREYVARTMQALLNWIQQETDKRATFRDAITDMIVKGGGCLWTQPFTPPASGTIYPRTTFDPIDNLLVDPDATKWDDVLWISRKRCRPKWEWERQWNLPQGTLTGSIASHQSRAANGKPNEGDDSKKDYLECWEVWSKMGMGQRIHGMENAARHLPIDLEQFGDFTYLVIAKGVDFPLNLPNSALVNQEDAFMRVQWPLPLYKDNPSGGWPMTMVRTYNATDTIWPISIGKMVIGELRFVNWAFSFMADRIAAGSKTIISVAKECAEQIRNDIEKSQGPFTLIELAEISGKSINDVIQFLNAPDPGTGIWTMISAVLEQIDKRTGLTELMYGMAGSQMRSATEAQVRSGNMAVRPDDMAECVEAAASHVARKEAIAAHWLMRKEDVAPILGPVASLYYEQQIALIHPDEFIRDYIIRIEAGSVRKPNRQAKQQQLNEFGQIAIPALMQAWANGDDRPLNAYLRATADALQLDPADFQVQPIPPPPPMLPPEAQVA